MRNVVYDQGSAIEHAMMSVKNGKTSDVHVFVSYVKILC